MKIDYVVIASDSNPLYTDFYAPVSKVWNHFGYKTFMLEICDEESDIYETEFGIYKKVKSVSDNTALQSQVVRLYANRILKNKNLLLSDIDMMPMSIEYFENRSNDLPSDKILLYSGQPYKVNPFYPMCYVLANSDIISNALGITDKSFKEFVDYLSENYKGDTKWGTIWNTDENFMYDKLSNYKDIILLNDRDPNRRVNRVNWGYDDEKVKNGYYIDSHLLRPYKQYKGDIERMVNLIIK
jgi:hypothetical protein